ncbi:MAG: tetratricopeptide repeat protein, partial [Candidatus Omnitrophica bacterium]|nr:tetratricopeptide repeat protein [Candidatus Omnitrophota bacterium]
MKKIAILSLSLVIIAAATSFLYHYTQQAKINYHQGHRLFLKGNYSKAIPYYKNSLKVDPRQLKVKKELAYSYFWTDNPKKAIPLFQDISKKNPKNQELKLYLAEAYSRTGSRNKALSIMDKIEVKSKQPDVKMALAEIYIWNSQLVKARKLLR